MNRYLIILLCIFIFVMSCTHDSNKKTEQNPEEATPEVLVKESFGDYEWDLIGSHKRYDQDMITTLYKEALKKDPDLAELDRRIKYTTEVKYDSLKFYERYMGINEGYWEDVHGHISQFNDSLLEEAMRNHFHKRQSDFDTKIARHRAKNDTIEKRSLALDDQALLLKLRVTERMIKNFQQNEIPDIEQMERVLREYDVMIEELRKIIEK